MDLLNCPHPLRGHFRQGHGPTMYSWIEPDTNKKEYVFVAIEAGALNKVRWRPKHG